MHYECVAIALRRVADAAQILLDALVVTPRAVLFMSASPKLAALRRMKLEELLIKLEQIEQQAALTLDEYPRGLIIERQRLILAIAKQLQSHEGPIARRPEARSGGGACPSGRAGG